MAPRQLHGSMQFDTRSAKVKALYHVIMVCIFFFLVLHNPAPDTHLNGVFVLARYL